MTEALQTKFIKSQQPSNCLMVVLHGLGDSSMGYEWMPDILNLPWLNYLLVNAPDPYYGGYSWYDFAGNPGPGIERSRTLLFQLLDAQQEAGFPVEKTIVFGFSQGSLMTLEIASKYPKKLAGLIGISGYAHEPGTMITQLSPVAKEQQILCTHGTADPIIGIQIVRPQMKLLQSAGLQIQYVEFPKPHGIAGDAEIQLIRNFVRKVFNQQIA